jgi:two-component system sensor histidine kinase/response regulator
MIVKQKDELEKTVEARDKLYSLIAHDLRSPVGSLRMVMNALSMGVDRESIEEDMYEILIMGNRLAEDTFVLLDNLLKWTKSQTGRLKTVFQNDVDIYSLIRGELEVAEVVAELKQITISIDGYTESKARIDQDMIKTVLRNLLNNAIKFSERGSEINVMINESDERVQISVKDSGRGIKESEQSKIFKTSIHISSYGTEKEEGSGLGLLLCKEFITRNNGNIWFESEEGKGSVFSFDIPIQR